MEVGNSNCELKTFNIFTLLAADISYIHLIKKAEKKMTSLLTLVTVLQTKQITISTTPHMINRQQQKMAYF